MEFAAQLMGAKNVANFLILSDTGVIKFFNALNTNNYLIFGEK